MPLLVKVSFFLGALFIQLYRLILSKAIVYILMHSHIVLYRIKPSSIVGSS
ncbi:hypothetical protein RchiOBHm_Chr4g0385551 [Rosa chinensis]|uniref:Uncharacterized protein n=1 Tax=Rosa chinensis TaxID=74649 RepID=A0A2P6QNY0_ROSCH|nr:hypothetical protein RchiOBHm_Chr4g0385551 [Rosa chinensis]